MAPVFDVLRRNPEFRKLWLAQVVSYAGDWLNRIALLALIGQLGGRSAWLGVGTLYAIELAFRLLPSALFGPLAGTFADRVSRHGTMIGTDLLRAGVVLLMVLVQEPAQLPWLYGLLLVQMGLATFFEAARSAVLPSTVARGDLHAAYALSAATWSTMLTAGMLLSWIAIEQLGVTGMFVLDAGTYVSSAVVLTWLRRVPMPKQADAFRWRDLAKLVDMRRGWAHARAVGALPGLEAKAFWAPVGGFLVMLSVVGRERFGLGADGDELALARAAGGATAILFAGRGLGTGIGPVLSRRWFGSDDPALLRVTRIGFTVAALGYAGFGFAQNLWLASACVLAAHLGGGGLWVASTTFWMSRIDDAYRGRVRAIEMWLSTTAITLGGFVGGVLFDLSRSIDLTVGVLAVLTFLGGLGWSARARFTASDPASDTSAHERSGRA